MLVTHPSILEAAVVAIADEKWGEVPKAYITVKDSGSGSGAAVSGSEVIAWARENPKFPRFMVPKAVEIIKELPKTSTGKLRKNILRDWARGKKTEA